MSAGQPDGFVYVAFGDSISIDEYAGGPGRGGASLLFRNRDDDFPQWRGRDLVSLHPQARFGLLATDGATTRTLADVQLPRLAALPVRPTLVTLTIGGNDLLSAYGDTPTARLVIAHVRAQVSWALEQVSASLAPGGRVVVGTVYDPSDGTGDAGRLGLPPWPDAVAVIAELNDVLRSVAVAGGAAVAEIAQRFHGHGLLAGDAARPDPRPAEPELWLCSVIEPNAWGASGVREAFWAAAGLDGERPAGQPAETTQT
jgi:lysophospholipase L1-like esterase